MLAVHPKHQRKGFGTKLIQHCSAIADAAGIPTYLSSFPQAHHLYEKLGYTDIGYFDLDLNDWGTKLSGFGVYRQSTMVRQPVKGSE
jgi:ribosomal protein S18 acetylase RimI-like enzyme